MVDVKSNQLAIPLVRLRRLSLFLAALAGAYIGAKLAGSEATICTRPVLLPCISKWRRQGVKA